MITTYFRSSSFNTHDYCPHKFFLDYVLGYQSPANKKAEKGTITHKALELLAHYKKCQQEGKTSFFDEELKLEFILTEMTPEKCINLAYAHFSAKTAHLYSWDNTDLRDCNKWLQKALTFNGGMFSPLLRQVIVPEQYFDFEIVKPWSKYSFTLPDGEKLEGYLGLKGTVDLIVKVPGYPNMIELIDWKTGAYRKDINTGKVKEYSDFQKDPQLRIYHYALHYLYPNVEQIMITIFYINAGGPFSLCFTKDDLKATEKMLQKKFEVIKNTVRPKLIYPHFLKCKKLCWFYKHDVDNQPVDDYKKSCCKVVKDELVQLGMDKVLVKRAQRSFTEYGGGGGRYTKGSN